MKGGYFYNERIKAAWREWCATVQELGYKDTKECLDALKWRNCKFVRKTADGFKQEGDKWKVCR